jgi:tetratricopeptide (TPR) repeat protein
MKRPYNRACIKAISARNSVKLEVLILLLTVATGGISCGAGVSAPADGVAARPVGEAIAEADQLYAGRADLAKVRQGVLVLRQGQAEDQANYELAWRLAKFNYYLGAHSPQSAERDKAFVDGIQAGELAVKVQDGKPEGHFWLGANYGGTAKNRTFPSPSDFDSIKREMEAVIKLDEGYQTGSAYMALGQLYREAPRLLGGDTQKAIDYLEKGLRFGPTNSLLRAHLAEAYAQAQRNDDARKQIESLLAMKPAPGFEPEYEESVALVRKLQEKMK